jgi:hypothetical protein
MQQTVFNHKYGSVGCAKVKLTYSKPAAPQVKRVTLKLNPTTAAVLADFIGSGGVWPHDGTEGAERLNSIYENLGRALNVDAF